MFSALLKKDKKKNSFPKEEFRRLHLRIARALFPFPPPAEGEDVEASADFSNADLDYTQDIDGFVSRVCDTWQLTPEDLMARIAGKKLRKPIHKLKLIERTNSLVDDPESALVEERIKVYKNHIDYDVPAPPPVDPSKPPPLVVKLADVDWDCPPLCSDVEQSFVWQLWINARESRWVLPPADVVFRTYRKLAFSQAITPSHPDEGVLRGVVVGKSLVGKTTVAKHIAAMKKVRYLSTQEIIASHPLLVAQLRKGQSIPSVQLCAALRAEILSRACQHAGYVIDDFPSDFDFCSLPAELAVNTVIELDCPDDVLMQRISQLKVDARNVGLRSEEDDLVDRLKAVERERRRQRLLADGEEPEEEAELETSDDPRPEYVRLLCAPEKSSELVMMDSNFGAAALRSSVNCNTKRSEVLCLVDHILSRFPTVESALIEEPEPPVDADSSIPKPNELVVLDLVAYTDHREWRRIPDESREFTAYYRGRQFFFASDTNLQTFLSCPRRYDRQYPRMISAPLKKLLPFGVIATRSVTDAMKAQQYFGHHFVVMSAAELHQYLSTEGVSDMKRRVDEEVSGTTTPHAFVIYAATNKELNVLSGFIDFMVEVPSAVAADDLVDSSDGTSGADGTSEPVEEELKIAVRFDTFVKSDPFYPPVEILESEDSAMESVDWKCFGNYPFGITFVYDPVEIVVQQSPATTMNLRCGKPDIACKFAHCTYWFSSEKNRSVFLEDPRQLVLDVSAIFAKPDIAFPARIWISGPDYAGKSTLASSLSALLDLPVVQFSTKFIDSEKASRTVAGNAVRRVENSSFSEDHSASLLRSCPKGESLNEHDGEAASDKIEEAAGSTEAEEEVDPEAAAAVKLRRTAAVFAALLGATPFSDKGYILDGTFAHDIPAGVVSVLMDEFNVTPTLHLHVSCSDETAVSRWKAEFLQTPEGHEWDAKQKALESGLEVAGSDGEDESVDPAEAFKARWEQSMASATDISEKVKSICPLSVSINGEYLCSLVLSHAKAAYEQSLGKFASHWRKTFSVDCTPSRVPPVLKLLIHHEDRELACSLAAELGLKYISAKSVLADPWYLRGEVERIARSGSLIPRELWLRILDAVICESQCVMRGFIIDDDFDMDIVANDYDRFGIQHAFLVLPAATHKELHANEVRRVDRFRRDSAMFPRFLTVIEGGHRTLWRVRSEVMETVSVLSNALSQTASAVVAGRPHAVRYLPIPQTVFLSRLLSTSYRSYCPVCWVDHEELHDCIGNVDREYVVAIGAKLYATCSEDHMSKVISTCDHYLDTTSHPLPPQSKLPKAVDGAVGKARGDYQLLSYSPVSLVQGDPSCAALYDGKLFAFCNSADRDKFMRKPGLYAGRQLPPSLLARIGSVAALSDSATGTNGVNDLQVFASGYMDMQGISQASSDALLFLTDIFRKHGGLKHPQLSPSESALKLLSLYLKSRRPASDPNRSAKAAAKLERFLRACTLALESPEDEEVKRLWVQAKAENVAEYLSHDKN